MAIIINLKGVEAVSFINLLTEQISSIPKWVMNHNQIRYVDEYGRTSLAYLRTEDLYYEETLKFYFKYSYPQDAAEANESYHWLNDEFKTMLEANFGQYIESCVLQDLRPNELE